jgi:hypothetical protein
MFQTRGAVAECFKSRATVSLPRVPQGFSRPSSPPGVHPAVVVRVMNDEQSQEVEALAAIMGEDMWTDAEQPRSYCFFVSPQCDSDTEVCCC